MAVGGGGVEALFYRGPITPGDVASWDSPGVLKDGGGGMAIGSVVAGGTSGSVLFIDANGNLAQQTSLGVSRNQVATILQSQLPAIILPYGDDALIINPPVQSTTSGAPFSISPTLARLWSAGVVQTGGGVYGISSQDFSYVGNPPASSWPVWGFIHGIINVAFYHTGQNLEIGYTGHFLNGTGDRINLLIRVNGQYLSLSPIVAPNTSDTYWLKLAFSSRATRRIDLVGMTGYFPGVATDAVDTITPAELRGPVVAISGDSFLGGSNGSLPPQTYGQVFADAVGWDYVFQDGIGGSGYTVGTTLASRFSGTILPLNPQLYIIAVGRNDVVTAAATTQSTATSTLATIKAALPNTVILVCGALWSSGAGGWTGANIIETNSAIKAAAAANGLPFLDFLNQPIPSYITPSGYTVDSGSAITAGASTFVATQVAPFLPAQCNILIGTDYAEVISNSNNTYTIAGTFASNHAAGSPITLLGQSFWSGTGNIGAPTGFGNCDVFVYSDTIHPTVPAQYHLGVEIAKRVKSYLRGQTDPWGQAV